MSKISLLRLHVHLTTEAGGSRIKAQRFRSDKPGSFLNRQGWLLSSALDGGGTVWDVCAMKRLLLSVCLVGIVFVGRAPNDLQITENATASTEAFVAERAVTVVRKSAGGIVRQNPDLQRVAFRPSADGSQAAGVTGSAPAPSVAEIFAPSLPQKADSGSKSGAPDGSDANATWVVVIRGTPVHNGPSVSAPIVSYFAVGKELNLVGSEQGWYQVFDPETSQQGWVYAQYYVEPSDGPGRKRVAAQETAVPVKATPVATAPSKAVRRILQQQRFLAPPQAEAENTAPRARPSGESVMSLLARALQR